ncbi:hypothetical protein K440DRAFT_540975 [Wilcoxina mikolae CBS 423.85]|nr:hypothetical protein K440DRAFT_540975 [Wilcoxina mikolae CBS 423.85]
MLSRSLPNLPPFLSRLLRKARLLPAPPSTPLKPTDTLWIYDNIAYPSSTSPSGWTAEFISAYFLANSGKGVAEVVADISEKLGLGKGDAAEARIAERVQAFLDIVVEGRTVEVDFAGQGRITLGPSQAGGVAMNHIPIPGRGYQDGEELISTAALPSGIDEANVIATMKTRFAGKDGWAVVSDIDDTIKVSHVRDRIALLRYTFALEPQSVDEMPRLYSHLDRVLKPAWYYLSASPYNLYPMLRSFIGDNFPQGQLLLREMSWQELESFVVSLTVGTQKYKEKELERLVTFLPERKWVLIGDSTQKDPEAYATAYKRNPEKVRRIWIRVVEGVNRMEEGRLNSDERFATAFKGVPREVWRTFKHAGELEELVSEIV